MKTRIVATLKSQYHAELAMLRQAIEQCPDDLWYSQTPRNAYWQVAYHVLFFAHLYLMPNEAAFRPWARHQRNAQHEDCIPGPADPESKLPLIPPPYAKADVLEYWSFCDDMVDSAVDAIDLDGDASGFSWYRMSKLEHQFINIRHIQHHTAQLADRLRAHSDIGVRWVSSGRKPS
jgi:hypothetical protein